MMNVREAVNVLPYAPSQGTLGAEKKRWHAVYVDDVYKLDGGEVKSIDDIYASKSIITAQNNSVAEVQAGLAALRELLDNKADKSHGNHVPALLPYAANYFLASDGSFKEVKPADIDAPRCDGTGAHGTWHIDIDGNAATATMAEQCQYAIGVNATANNRKRAEVVGVNDMKFFFDDRIYITENPGEMYIETLQSTTVNANTAVLNNGMLTMKQGTTSCLLQVNGSTLNCSLDFSAPRVHNAIWNDYAEFFESDDAEAEPGDIIARLPGKMERYGRATAKDMAVGVYSNEYAHVIGGLPAEDGKTVLETNKGKFIPVALAGRVHVKVKGEARVGQWVIPSADPGIGVAVNDPLLSAIGRVLVDKDTDAVGLVRVLVK